MGHYFMIVFISICTPAIAVHFKVFKNSLDPGNFGDSSAGAILEESGGDEGIHTVLDAFTLCLRFQLKVLGSRNHGDRGMVANIGDM